MQGDVSDYISDSRRRFQNFDVEIGFGKSALLLRLAKENPSTFYVGVDINLIWYEKANETIINKKLHNVFVVNDEAKGFIENNIQSNSVDSYHVYFPSPGPRELRFFYENTAMELYRTLGEGGHLKIITDDEEYFSQILEVLDQDCWQFVPWVPLNIETPEGFVIGTECEREYGAKYKLQVIKRG